MLYQGNIRDYLSKQPLLFDGAMGTYLADKYIQFGGESCEKWNLRYPERIKQIHKEYIDAGAVAIKTGPISPNNICSPADSSIAPRAICVPAAITFPTSSAVK